MRSQPESLAAPDAVFSRFNLEEMLVRQRGNDNPDPDILRTIKIEPGTKVRLRDFDPSFAGDQQVYEKAVPEVFALLQRIGHLQELMHAEKRHSLLIVLQALDAGGKDGLMRHILSGVNPAGSRVAVFKQPTREELGHDFLWRVHPHVPAKGEIVIFNRSHYEDVLVVRVHGLVPEQVWSKRYEYINDLERLLVLENHTTILKFLLHISKDEQLARFKRRLDDPMRRWKISEADYEEREHWENYERAFEDMLEKTSTKYAPWYVIPSNHKWFRDLLVSRIIARALEELEMHLPEAEVDIEAILRRYHAAEKASQGTVNGLGPHECADLITACEGRRGR